MNGFDREKAREVLLDRDLDVFESGHLNLEGALDALSECVVPATIDRDALLQVLTRAGFDTWTAAGVRESILALLRPDPRVITMYQLDSELVRERAKLAEAQYQLDAMIGKWQEPEALNNRLGAALYAAYVALGEDTDGAHNWRELFLPLVAPPWDDLMRRAVLAVVADRDVAEATLVEIAAEVAQVAAYNDVDEFAGALRAILNGDGDE